MTSNHLFFRVMREDIRHKIWMIALSVLGNFIAQPVLWLLLTRNYDKLAGNLSREEFFTKAFYGIMEQASGNMFAFSGFVCIVMAFVTGVWGFRYVFRKDMVDTYHSLPVKRSTLYGACYLNGILIWFLPFITFLASSFAMMCGFAGRLERTMGTLVSDGGIGVSGYPYLGEPLWTMLAKEAVLTVVVLIVVYFMVYHMALTAVMLSGNILNTLVSMVIMGLGVIAVYGLGNAFISLYLGNHYPYADDWTGAIYASPLCSAVYLLYRRVEESGGAGLWLAVLVNTGIAILLGVCVYCLYKRRASEMAEQGITNKAVAAALRLVTSVCAGMFGWLIMAWMKNELQHALWGSFGAVLAAGLAAGILDVIFQMDFGAFFAHKCQMAAGIVLSLLLCGSFCGDWFGYDSYLPKKEKIAYIAVSDWNLSSKASYTNTEYLLENMRYQDSEVIYAWLERIAADGKVEGVYDYVDTKVTLKNGSSYYRRYSVTREDRELLWPILISREYMEYAYLIDEELVDKDSVNINVMGRQIALTTAEGWEIFRSILQAYRQDVTEHPETVLQSEGRVLATVSFDILWMEKGMASLQNAKLVICEGMEYSVEALRKAGYGEYMDGRDASEILAIVLKVESGVVSSETPEEIVGKARAYYGVPVRGGTTEEERELADGQETAEEGQITDKQEMLDQEELMDRQEAAEKREMVDGQGTMEDWERTDRVATGDTDGYTVRVSDPEEIEELLGLISVMHPTHTSRIFQKAYRAVTVIDAKGNSERWYIQQGALPEKYILRFGGDS